MASYMVLYGGTILNPAILSPFIPLHDISGQVVRFRLLGVDSVFVHTLLNDWIWYCILCILYLYLCVYLCKFDIVIEVLIPFLCTQTVDWLILKLWKTNGDEQVTQSEPWIAWSLIIQFLSPTLQRNRAGSLPLLPPLFRGWTGVASDSFTSHIVVSLVTLLLGTWIKCVTVTVNFGTKIYHKTCLCIYMQTRPNQNFILYISVCTVLDVDDKW